MVNIDERVQQIKKMVDRGDYFCINRGRQYGKTTTLRFLKKALDSEYTVFSISFEGADDTFEKLDLILQYFFIQLMQECQTSEKVNISSSALRFLKRISGNSIFKIKPTEANIFNIISNLCKKNKRKIVVIIDEVDQAGNYDAFIKFLGILRKKYL